MMEFRTTTEDVELRSAPDGGRTLVAYAAVWEAESRDLGGFIERVMPGAFQRTLSMSDVVAVVNHDQSQLLGRKRSGTLRLEEDGYGLRYEVDLPDTTAGRDLATSVERGDITGSSFKFRAVHQEWDRSEDRGLPLRSLTEVALADVGPVTIPAYEATEGQLALRSLIESEEAPAASDEQDMGDAEPAEEVAPEKAQAFTVVRHRFLR